ncbi:tRNA lysidine(34) synthetase TilS [Paenibacillus oenotherae]|uniref:tRNA(Ile)-lysidine synthase n=1 Tax=Paenibacillus oenotherae TaxID=1435645 RepID=A0ABS7DC40_9BACL|nr:tRNA lysidine(34) synthetase TilS [Paenibacillus oenotherae]MBW7477420.1 tRNA lysidine(34) synthetase TilS [Paenibacillus oenotherae]
MEDWLNVVSQTAAEERLWAAGDTIVVAVSGGPDSVALLHILHELAPKEGLTLIAAHVDHGFRGEESALEAESVKQMAGELGIVCESTYIDLPAYIEETGMNPQSAAREKRYAYLHEVAEKHQAKRIAIAHHGDDQAETVLMRIVRGTSPGGLSGIPIRRTEKNVELIRPLLRMYKADILSFCKNRGLRYSQDSSNEQRYYFRNTVRLDLLPALAQYNPEIANALVRLSLLAAQEDEWMEGETQAAFHRYVRQNSVGCQMNREALLSLHVALQRRMIKLILKCVGLEMETTSFDIIETIRHAADRGAASTWSIDAGRGIRFVREYDVLRFIRAQPESGSLERSGGGYEYIVTEGAAQLEVSEADARLIFSELPSSSADRPKNRQEAIFDAALLQYPLTVRNRRPGDRMAVLGLNGTKKVQDMFVDDRIAPSQREILPLLVDGEGKVLWIPGVRRSDAAQVLPSTTRVLHIRMENPASDNIVSNKMH